MIKVNRDHKSHARVHAALCLDYCLFSQSLLATTFSWIFEGSAITKWGFKSKLSKNIASIVNSSLIFPSKAKTIEGFVSTLYCKKNKIKSYYRSNAFDINRVLNLFDRDVLTAFLLSPDIEGVKYEITTLLRLEQTIINSIKSINSSFVKDGIIDSKIVDLLSLIFDWGKLNTSGFPNRQIKENYTARDLCSRTNLVTCPYCNSQFTFVIEIEEDKRVSRPQYDHFYPSSLHPLLCISYFNLVPSCFTCNNLKRNLESEELLHPYFNGFQSEAFFTIEPSNSRSLVGFSDQFELKLMVDESSINSNGIKKNINFFGLKEIYGNHKGHAREIYFRAFAYNYDYLASVKRTFQKQGVLFNKENVFKFIFNHSLREEELEQTVLAKMTRDIALSFNKIRLLHKTLKG